MKRLLNRTYGGLASLKLTIVVLSVLAVALIAGTFYESANGTPMAHRAIYASGWFDAILILLALNMVACTAKRYPYKPHQLGFLMVHCGILTILTGAMLTRNFGREGELFVNEGEARDFMTSARPYLRISVPEDGVVGHEMPVVFPARADGTRLDEILDIQGSPLRFHFSRYFPNSRWQDDIEEGDVVNPALQVRISLKEDPRETWILPRRPGHESFEAGPVQVEALEAETITQAEDLLTELENDRPKGRGMLHLQAGDQELAKIPLEGEVPRRVTAGAFEIRLREWYSHFTFRDDRPVNASEAMTNPAVLFDVEGPEGTENHIAFAFHEFRSLIAPESDRGYDIHAQYVYDGLGQTRPTVRFVRSPEGTWRLAANFDLDVDSNHEVQIGRKYQSSAARFEIEVLRIVDRAEFRRQMINVSRDELNPALRMQILDTEKGGEPTWIVYGEERNFKVGDRTVAIEFGRRQMPLGFSVQLVDFRETTYPGTTRSATFASDVIVADDRGEPVPIHISMNKPLKYRGFRLFQSSFVRDGGREASIFSVSYDPGVNVVYTGFIIFIVGLIAIFYLKPVIKRSYTRPAIRKDLQ